MKRSTVTCKPIMKAPAHKDYHDICDEDLQVTGSIILGRKTKKYDHTCEYVLACCGFDIETTRVKTKDKAEPYHNYMYIWQFNINGLTITGRKWHEYFELLERLKAVNQLHDKRHLIIWDANLGYEFSFICRYQTVEAMFAKAARHPISYVADGCLEYRDALAVTNTDLKKLAESYCTTRKLKGDLDYSIIRNSKTPLSPEELQYCINDVQILAEFAERMFNDYIIPKRFIPITASNLIRRNIKGNITQKKLMTYHIKQQFPKRDEYSFMMDYLFRGGLAHSNAPYVGIVIEDGMEIEDITSSYPYYMLAGYVPVTPFRKCFYNFHDYLDTHCCKILITFMNIRSRTSHSLESKNKIVNIKLKSSEFRDKAFFDNGRLHSCTGEVTVYLTELDYKNYQMFYEWDDEKVLNFEIAQRGKMPAYLVKALTADYKLKNDLKIECHKNGVDPDSIPDYGIVKRRVNTYYGVAVTRMHLKQDIYDNLEGWKLINNFDYNGEVEKAFLLPQWGIWITAGARHRLAKVIKELTDQCGNVVMQYDTDSVIFKRSKVSDRYFKQLNNDIYKSNIEVCKYWDIDYDTFYDLGSFDIKCNPVKFKCLGAKRYIYTKPDGGLVCTVAGLPKKTLEKHCKQHNLDPYEFFSDGMYYDMESSDKLRVAYIDHETKDLVIDPYGNAEEMQEKTSCVLINTMFKMTLKQEFTDYLTTMYNRKRREVI